MKSVHLDLDDNELARNLAGARGEYLKLVERRLGVRIGHRGAELHLAGPEAAVTAATRLCQELAARLRSGSALYRDDVEQALRALERAGPEGLEALALPPVLEQRGGRRVAPRGLAQRRYVELMRDNDVVLGIGPAGTGKTYLAMAVAVASLLERRVKRIVLARPAVEAGEKLGFLPGDLAEKVNPYLRPLYDALHDMLEFERAQQLVAQGIIEVAPLAFMRGRTLSDAFAILDEAQNTTVEQMKMFLTRLGSHSKAVITGDVTQIDLPAGTLSGLVHAERILTGIDGIALARFTEQDVVRHPIVQDIIRAYAADAGAAPAAGAPERAASTPPRSRGGAGPRGSD